jgi:hypothetical protein
MKIKRKKLSLPGFFFGSRDQTGNWQSKALALEIYVSAQDTGLSEHSHFRENLSIALGAEGTESGGCAEGRNMWPSQLGLSLSRSY